jgi:hypothetical protein
LAIEQKVEFMHDKHYQVLLIEIISIVYFTLISNGRKRFRTPVGDQEWTGPVATRDSSFSLDLLV